MCIGIVFDVREILNKYSIGQNVNGKFIHGIHHRDKMS